MYPSSVVLSHTKVIVHWSLETAMFDLSVISPCKGTVRGLKVPTLSVGYLKMGYFGAIKTLHARNRWWQHQLSGLPQQLWRYRSVCKVIYINIRQKFNRKRHHQSRRPYCEETKGTSSLFTVVALLHWQLHLFRIFISNLAFSRITLCCIYSHAGFSLFKIPPPPQSHKRNFLSQCPLSITTEI